MTSHNALGRRLAATYSHSTTATTCVQSTISHIILRSMSCTRQIQGLQWLESWSFATHGISDTFHSDNGPPFNSNEFSAQYHQHRTAQDTQCHCAVSKQVKDYQLSDQRHHQLSVRRTVKLLVVDAPFVLPATWKTMFRPSLYFFVKTFWNDFLYLFTLVTVQFFQRRKGVRLLLSRNPLSRDSTQRIICVRFHVLADWMFFCNSLEFGRHIIKSLIVNYLCASYFNGKRNSHYIHFAYMLNYIVYLLHPQWPFSGTLWFSWH